MPNQHFSYIRTEYHFTSGSGTLDSLRYITEYQIRIYLDDTRGAERKSQGESTEIGRAWVSLFLIGLAMDRQLSLIDVFDESGEYIDLYEHLFDGEELIPVIQKNYESFCLNLLYIRRIELLPNWRGKGLGRKLLKDIILRFDGCCGVVVLNAQPLQFKTELLDSTTLWHQQLLLGSLSLSSELARQKLDTFFKSVGFSQLPRTSWHYLCLGSRNPSLDQINLDEGDKV